MFFKPEKSSPLRLQTPFHETFSLDVILVVWFCDVGARSRSSDHEEGQSDDVIDGYKRQERQQDNSLFGDKCALFTRCRRHFAQTCLFGTHLGAFRAFTLLKLN